MAKEHLERQTTLTESKSGAMSQMTFNKYPTKVEGKFADFPSVRDSEATLADHMLEYRINHVQGGLAHTASMKNIPTRQSRPQSKNTSKPTSSGKLTSGGQRLYMGDSRQSSMFD